MALKQKFLIKNPYGIRNNSLKQVTEDFLPTSPAQAKNSIKNPCLERMKAQEIEEGMILQELKDKY